MAISLGKPKICSFDICFKIINSRLESHLPGTCGLSILVQVRTDHTLVSVYAVCHQGRYNRYIGRHIIVNSM